MKINPGPNALALFDDLPTHFGDAAVLRDLRLREQTEIVEKGFTFVQTDSELEQAMDAVREYGKMAFDTETNGLTWSNRAVAFSFAIDGRAWLVPTRMVHANRNFTADEVQGAVQDVYADPEVKKIAHASKFDMHMMLNTYGVAVDGVIHDTLIAQWILNENEPHDLETMAETWLKARSWKIKQDGNFGQWPIKVATNYACRDVKWTLKMYEFQKPELEQRPKLWSLMYDLELPIALKAFQKEQVGIRWDDKYCEDVLRPHVMGMLSDAKAECVKVFGNINLDSPEQVSRVLFDGLGLPEIKGRSTDKAVLAELRKHHPVIPHFEVHRTYATAKKMFMDQLPNFVDMGRIHPSASTIGTVTGRETYAHPNLQQIPKKMGPLFRRAFIPTEGYVFVSMDYSQIELRLLAHMSQDAVMIKAFLSGEDFHSVTCNQMFGISMEALRKDKDMMERIIAKSINFGVLYGVGAAHLAEMINALLPEDKKITIEQAQEFIDKWFAAFPSVKQWTEDRKYEAVKEGFVETIMGRKRRLPGARHPDGKISSAAKRQAVNSPLQGSAADMVKKAELDIDDVIAERAWPYRQLLQIHDELLLEVPKKWLQRNMGSLEVLKLTMQNAYPLIVPVVVSLDTLDRWGDKVIVDEDLEIAA
jgi:DNA polymerase I